MSNKPENLKKDIRPQELLTLDWKPENVNASLNTVLTFVTSTLEGTIDWYLKQKNTKKWWATKLRVGIIFATAFASVFPILQKIFSKVSLPGGNLYLSKLALLLGDAGWSAIFLACAALMLALDRFFGFSTAWMRYIDTQLRLQQVLQDFKLDWESEKASWQGEVPTKDQTNKMLTLAKTCLDKTSELVQQETTKWIQEFQDALRQIDVTATPKPVGAGQNVTEGSITITVPNGDQCTNGWQLRVDDKDETHETGKTATRSKLSTGPHEFKVTGIIQGVTKNATGTTTISVGGTATLSLTLA